MTWRVTVLIIAALWQPFGKLYLICWNLHLAGYSIPKSLWRMLTRKLYHIMFLDAGHFGFLTPLINNWLRNRNYK